MSADSPTPSRPGTPLICHSTPTLKCLPHWLITPWKWSSHRPCGWILFCFTLSSHRHCGCHCCRRKQADRQAPLHSCPCHLEADIAPLLQCWVLSENAGGMRAGHGRRGLHWEPLHHRDDRRRIRRRHPRQSLQRQHGYVLTIYNVNTGTLLTISAMPT